MSGNSIQLLNDRKMHIEDHLSTVAGRVEFHESQIIKEKERKDRLSREYEWLKKILSDPSASYPST